VITNGISSSGTQTAVCCRRSAAATILD
jgi:hypothetical protein